MLMLKIILVRNQWRTQKISKGKDKVSSQSCDVTNQL